MEALNVLLNNSELIKKIIPLVAGIFNTYIFFKITPSILFLKQMEKEDEIERGAVGKVTDVMYIIYALCSIGVFFSCIYIIITF